MDWMSIFGKAKEMQEKFKEAQEGLAHLKVTAEAGAGLVKATVNGKKQILTIEIDSSLLQPADKDTVQDLTVAAINKALQEIEAKANEHLQQNTKDLLGGIPGMDWSKFGL